MPGETDPESGAYVPLPRLTVTLVAHVAGGPGGMEAQLQRLVSGVLEKGGRVKVIAWRSELDPHPALEFIRVRGAERPFPLSFPSFFVLASLLLRRHREGVVHTTGAIVSGRADLSTVHFCHRGFREKVRLRRGTRAGLAYRLNAALSDLMGRLAERYCYRPEITRRLVAVSTGVAEELRQYFPRMAGRIGVVPNGVDRAVFRPDSRSRARLRGEWGTGDDDPVALFVGGDWERKGLQFAVEALVTATKWQLVVVGPGDERAYRELAGRLGVASRLHFAGSVRTAAAHYAAADAFLLPTAYEAFPLVALEAAAAGLPLLMTSVNGVEDLLVEGGNGRFVPRDAETIGQRLQELQDPALRQRMGEAACKAVAEYDWPDVVDAYVELYEALAAG